MFIYHYLSMFWFYFLLLQYWPKVSIYIYFNVSCNIWYNCYLQRYYTESNNCYCGQLQWYLSKITLFLLGHVINKRRCGKNSSRGIVLVSLILLSRIEIFNSIFLWLLDAQPQAVMALVMWLVTTLHTEVCLGAQERQNWRRFLVKRLRKEMMNLWGMW